MTRPILIGTGFYATKETYVDKATFSTIWMNNTFAAAPSQIVIVDNNESWASNGSGISGGIPWRYIAIRNNLGHSGNSAIHGNRLMGWSMSWIIPALIAYSEGCDFVYKEQDCLAFGDWLPEIRKGEISYGYNSRMPCEQSLFYIARDTIPAFVAEYMAIPDPDNVRVPEDKMACASARFAVHRFEMPFGRERPLKAYTDRPWYAQKITPEELEEIRKTGLI